MAKNHDLLIKMDASVGHIKERLQSGATRMENIESRLRGLEKWQWMTIGAATVVSVIINLMFILRR